MEHRCVLLTGGNAAGKTTALKAAQVRHQGLVGWRWIFADHELQGSVSKQFKDLNRVWADESVQGIAIEGVRIYNTVFRCLVASTVRRALYLGVVLQDYETGRAHIAARCAKAGKEYRGAFWDQGDEAVGHLFHKRYVGGVDKFLRTVGPLRDYVRQVAWFRMDLNYSKLATVSDWLDDQIGSKF
jgi:hypothetical protein